MFVSDFITVWIQMSLETNHYVRWSIFVSLRIFSFPNWIKHYIQTAKVDLAYGVCVHVINVFFGRFQMSFLPTIIIIATSIGSTTDFKSWELNGLLVYVLIGNQDLSQANLFISWWLCNCHIVFYTFFSFLKFRPLLPSIHI